MAFETVFQETPLLASSPHAVIAGDERSGGVSIMAYDQRFANSEVKMNASFSGNAVTLVSHNGEKVRAMRQQHTLLLAFRHAPSLPSPPRATHPTIHPAFPRRAAQAHTSDLDLPEEAWLGRMRARLEFSRRCKLGETVITVQTMRPELGPRVVNLTSSLVDIYPVHVPLHARLHGVVLFSPTLAPSDHAILSHSSLRSPRRCPPSPCFSPHSRASTSHPVDSACRCGTARRWSTPASGRFKFRASLST